MIVWRVGDVNGIEIVEPAPLWRIGAHILGREPEELFDGKGFCYIEVGGGHAMRGDGSFFELPRPTMNPRTPDAA